MAKTVEAQEQKTEEVQTDAPQEESKTQAQSVEFSEASESDIIGAGTSIDVLLDMNVPITVAIGKIDISIQRLLQLGPGSVLKLDKPINVPADLYLKNTKFATGNIVVINERFAVRIKQILNTGATINTTEE